MLDFVNKHPLWTNNHKTVYLKQSNDTYNAYMITKSFLDDKRTLFVVLANLYEAQKYYDKLSQLNNTDDVLFYPADQTLTAMMALGSPEFKSERMFTLKQLLSGKPFIVVTTMQGVMQRQLTPSDYRNSVKSIKAHQTYDINDLVTFFIYGGYQRTFTVENPGEFSVRGHILDFYTFDHEYPYRLDFFGDELDEIKQFMVDTQRSFKTIDCVEIAPIHELFFTDDMKNRAIKNIRRFFDNKPLSEREKDKLETDIESIEMRHNLDGLNLYIPFFNQEETTIFDFTDKYHTVMVDVAKMQINIAHIESDLDTYAVTMNGRSFLDIPSRISLDRQLKKPHIEIANLAFQEDKGESLAVEQISEYHGNLELCYQDFKELAKTYRVVFCVTNNHYQLSLMTFFKDKEPLHETLKDAPGFYMVNEASYGAFKSSADRLVVIDEAQLFSYRTRKAIRYRSVLNQSSKIRTVDDLTVGDFVVHYEYGIGQYVGLKTMELSGAKRDYLHIIYAGEEALYVPMDQIDMVLKYSSYEDSHPKLSKLGGKTWNKTKAGVRKRIKDLSDRLVKLYAVRDQSEGYAFAKDTEMQEAFEHDFAYEMTKDQRKAVIATKHDMESMKPMDRLICGDVGFGKTEVALRAAFKAVLNQKQVLYLVPTTVLARQHYYTFKERFDKYGANVALMSRFVTPKTQKEVVDHLAKGYVDVVIGTHRLLSKDIKYRDLGLLIIDEEQRFGVEHKEKIREIKQNVDTLTLSATPIPRTLQMSLMGLKDLSMIETPPLNRYPVQTYVVERQKALIKEAIEREIARGGQIFYLFNRVRGMEGMVAKLNKLVPEARITFAHGKMNRDQLETTLTDFIEHRYDILVSTTIIETGVDIPNTNTLIIHDADRLGLSQLYQIRGRVGRSDRIAYAYLLYEPSKIINEEAKKRLHAIEDFTALGSGYKIALRDLAIRGAGDILGAEQSGFINSVGIELYMKLLEEAVTGKSLDKEKPTTVEQVFAPRHVDPAYVNLDSARIEIHKRIADLNLVSDVEDLKDELTDRYGALDADLLLYMYEKLFKKLSAKVYAQKTLEGVNQTTLILAQEANQKIDGKKLFERAQTFKPRIGLSYVKGHIHMTMVTKGQKQHWLYLFDKFLEDYLYR